MSPRFYVEWFESRSGFIEAESESAARQAWIDEVEVEHEDEFDAGILTFHEVNERGEPL